MDAFLVQVRPRVCHAGAASRGDNKNPELGSSVNPRKVKWNFTSLFLFCKRPYPPHSTDFTVSECYETRCQDLDTEEKFFGKFIIQTLCKSRDIYNKRY